MVQYSRNRPIFVPVDDQNHWGANPSSLHWWCSVDSTWWDGRYLQTEDGWDGWLVWEMIWGLFMASDSLESSLMEET